MPVTSKAVTAAALAAAAGAPTNIEEGAAASFSGHYRYTSEKLNQVQGRYLATRHQLEQIRQPPVDSLTREVEITKAQVGAMLSELKREYAAMHEVVKATKALSDEVSGLLENDIQMRALLQKMHRKLDDFQQTLGHA